MSVATWALVGVTGALVVITFLYVHATWGLVRQATRAADAAQAEIPTRRRSVARALASEIETIRDRYMQVIGNELEEARSAGRLPAFGMYITEHYFTVYDGNSQWLGVLGEGVEEVVRFYVLTKALIEMHRRFSRLLDDSRSGVRLGQSPADYFALLMEDHDAALQAAQRALAALWPIAEA